MRQLYSTWCVLLFAVLTGSVAASATATETLPPVDEVLKALIKRAQSQRTKELDGYYLCTKQTVTEDMDSSGKVTNRKVKVGESRSQVGGASEANKWSSKNGFNLDEELLRRYAFNVERRDVFNNRPVFVMNFVPKTPAPPVRQFQDRLLNRAMGTLWVDETDHELVKASICLGEPVSFGILGSVDVFNFSFERARAEDGIWVTRWTDTYVKARKFIRPFQLRKRVDWTDFKKASVN